MVILAPKLILLEVKQTAQHGIGIAAVRSLRSLITRQAYLQASSRAGEEMGSYLLILNIKMEGFMALENQIPVLGLKMKRFLLAIIKSRALSICASLLIIASSTASAADSLPFYNSKEFTPHWIKPNSAELKGFHKIPPFSFINQDGENITERSFENQIYVAGFFFSTCPGICPTIRSKLSKVQDKFIDDPSVKILQHSIRPSSDTVETLKQYADYHKIKSGKWHLVTGKKEAIYSLAKGAYFASEDLGNIQNTNDFLHTESILLIDQNRHIRGIYNGLNSASMSYLLNDIEALKTEKADS